MRTTKAFTLTELLIVVGVIVILASMLLTITGQAWTSAQALVCQHRLEQIGTACQLYANEHKGYEVRATVPGSGEYDRWYMALLPYLGGGDDPSSVAVLACPLAGPAEGQPVTGGSADHLGRHLSEDILAILFED